VELLPFDLLITATHCGDSSGYRWTYEFKDSEGIDRTLVVDIALGVQGTDDPEMLGVTQFMRFVSLDGVDWSDPAKAEKLYIGRAMIDFLDRVRTDSPNELQPVRKEDVPRVLGSAALKMHDQNYICFAQAVADHGTPIIINNACSSWHRLASNFTFGGARAYIGALFPIMSGEASDIVVRLLGKHFGKPLPVALWSAQREVYGDNVRRPYVMTGVFPQRLRTSPRHVPRQLASQLSGALTRWRKALPTVVPRPTDHRTKKIEENIRFYERELAAVRKRWRL